MKETRSSVCVKSRCLVDAQALPSVFSIQEPVPITTWELVRSIRVNELKHRGVFFFFLNASFVRSKTIKVGNVHFSH